MESRVKGAGDSLDKGEYVQFIEVPVPGKPEYTLVITPGAVPRIAHPNCRQLADVSLELDAIYCIRCRLNDRISGYWVTESVVTVRDVPGWEQPTL